VFKKSGREIGEKIVSILKKIPEITNVEGILGARIPIVRFVHEESDLKCDLSFHNMMSVMNSKFLKMCQQADPRYVPDFFHRRHSITTWTRKGGHCTVC
jgi:DNA polymerase sigma